MTDRLEKVMMFIKQGNKYNFVAKLFTKISSESLNLVGNFMTSYNYTLGESHLFEPRKG